MWGYICNKFGKKKSLFGSESGLAVTTLLFGFTTSFTWTVVSRSFQGIFMGLIVISKSIIANIADQTNLATGLSFIFSANNIGYIIGLSMAGFLVFPIDKYPKVFIKGTLFIIRFKGDDAQNLDDPLSSQLVSNRVSHETSNTAVVCHQSRYKKLLRNKNFILSTTLYGMFSLTTVGYEDLFPLFASTNIKYSNFYLTQCRD
ncbi:uncharacterized protein LOC124816856 [Hydra vulgaris]|uniref:uncharacterized protein LOC124816856 n=1 Tax=Hydra vulgaris TaxID=6087 RepID=UPI0032EA0CC8